MSKGNSESLSFEMLLNEYRLLGVFDESQIE